MDVLRQKQRDSAGALGIDYTPLDEDREEIRLITFSPPSEPLDHEKDRSNHLVHCYLEMVSLKDVSPVFAEFVNANSTKPRRKVLADWLVSRRHGEHTPIKEGEVHSTSRRRVPEPDCYRYTWGDFAALSYVVSLHF